MGAIDHIADVCAAAGVAWGTVALSLEATRRMVKRGCQMLELASDVGSVRRGIEASRALHADFFKD